jgi:hypothetical protein
MFFVLSTGRSGSKAIAHTLSQSPDCICFHEPEPVLVKESTLYQYGLLSDHYMQALLLSTRPRKVYDKIYGESNQKFSPLIPVLSNIFPECKFIMLVRDGRKVVASTYEMREWYMPIYEQQFLPKNAKSHLKDWSWYRLRGDLVGDMDTQSWDNLSRFEKNCWLWTHVNNRILNDLKKIPKEKWMLVRLETLDEQIQSICKFLQIREPIQKSIHNNASPKKPTPWQKWPEEYKNAFQDWCGPLMNSLYPEWKNERGMWQPTSKNDKPDRLVGTNAFISKVVHFFKNK